MESKAKLLIIILLAVLLGCEFFDNSQSNEGTYIWVEATCIPGSEISYSYEIPDQRVIVGTDEGVFIYDPVLDTSEQYLDDTILAEMGYSIRFSEKSAHLGKVKEFNGKIYLYLTDGNTIVRESNKNLLFEVNESQDQRTFTEVLNLTRRFFDFWITPDGDIMIGSEFGTFMKPAESEQVLRNRFLDFLNWGIYFTTVNKVSAVYVSPSGLSLAGAVTGVYKSYDFGENWQRMEDSFPSNVVRFNYFLAGQNEGEIWAIGARALMVSINDGESWDMFYGIVNTSHSMFIKKNERAIYYNRSRKELGHEPGIAIYNIQTQEHDEYLGPKKNIQQFGLTNDGRIWASGPDGFFIGTYFKN